VFQIQIKPSKQTPRMLVYRKLIIGGIFLILTGTITNIKSDFEIKDYSLLIYH
jgi:hypothetical protein